VEKILGENEDLMNMQDSVALVCEKIRAAITEVEENTTGNKARAAFELVHLILSNIKNHPGEHKYQKISLKANTFQQKIGQLLGGLALMKVLGFSESSDQSSLLFQRNDAGLLLLSLSILQHHLSLLPLNS